MGPTFAPIALFVYNRPHHTKQTIQALQKAEYACQSTLFIFSDGPKKDATDQEINGISLVRDYINSVTGFKEIHVIESKFNKGLASSIIDGVNFVLNQYDNIIVLEDDILVSIGFLKYCNEALNLYYLDEEVMHISASNYDIDSENLEDTFFVKALSCQGWATWKRAWSHYNNDALDHLTHFQADSEKSFKFDLEGSAYFMTQLRKNVSGELNTWAVRWYASWLRAGGISLFPRKSLLYNIGFDGTGENSGSGKSYLCEKVEYINLVRVPIYENASAREKISKFWKGYLVHKKQDQTKIRQGLLGAQLIVKRKVVSILKIVFKYLITRLIPELAPFFKADSKSSLINILLTVHGSRLSNLSKVYAPGNISYSIVGRYTYIAPNFFISYAEIGSFCSIGPNFVCGWGVHPINGISTSPMFYSTSSQNGTTLCSENKIQERKKIQIGNDVFIGMNVTVLDGVRIGDGAVIGAGCVVSKDVPPYAVVVGIPMRISKYRFDSETINKLLASKWWEWPDDKLQIIEQNFFNTEDIIKIGDVDLQNYISQSVNIKTLKKSQ